MKIDGKIFCCVRVVLHHVNELATAGSTQLKAFSGSPMLPEKYLISFILCLGGMGKRGSGEVRLSMMFL